MNEICILLHTVSSIFSWREVNIELLQNIKEKTTFVTLNRRKNSQPQCLNADKKNSLNWEKIVSYHKRKAFFHFRDTIFIVF